jgi:hypothetical protein
MTVERVKDEGRGSVYRIKAERVPLDELVKATDWLPHTTLTLAE